MVAIEIDNDFCWLFIIWEKKLFLLAVGKVEEVKDMELQFFDLGTLKTATNNFSDENKLGEGGFGVVYKVRKKKTCYFTLISSLIIYCL